MAIYNEPVEEEAGETYLKIPRFYTPEKPPKTKLEGKLREEARTFFLKQRSIELIDNAELKHFWTLLNNHHTPPLHNGDMYITFSDYTAIKDPVMDKVSKFLTPEKFPKLESRSRQAGKVAIINLFNLLMRKVWIQQTRIGLSLYDVTGKGFLRETDLEAYIFELIPSLTQLDGLEKSFHSFYVCTAVRKFFFFLDPLRTGRIRIKDILKSNFLDELLELRDSDLPNLQENWFSAPSALSVYGHYLNLDKDHNGMLSKSELLGYGTGTLTSVFIDRLYEESITYDGDIDYKTYLDFVLALRHKPQSLNYFFRILDIDHKGYLTPLNLWVFFKGIQDQISTHRTQTVSFEDIKDEIYDMVRPVDPVKITLKDIVRCGQGETMISILIEFHKFWAYENRENTEHR